MKGVVALFLGIFGTFALSWAGLILIPNYQIGHFDPQVDEDGNDPYPAPKSGMAERGRKVYAANGCVYCHSQQVRADYAASDIDRKWGERRSAPRDYLFERPVLLGKMRMGPDLSNIGKRAPAEDASPLPPSSPTATSPGAQPAPGTSPATSPAPAASASPATAPAKEIAAAASSPSPAPASPAAAAASPAAPATIAAASPGATVAPDSAHLPYTAAWHHRHLYSPRSITRDSNMPAYHFLYEKRAISGQRSADALTLDEADAVPEGWEVVPTFDAKCLVAYLMSLDQSHALKEVKTAAAPPSSPAPAKEAK
jgi:cbb3-type cytochrome oxidase cytochrome c subunit